MYDMPVWYLGEFSLPVHWVLMAVCYAAVGFVVGVFGSLLSIRKFLKV